MGLTKKQHVIRRGGITATDLRAIVGLDPYGRTAHDVYTSKVLGSESWEPNEAQELGLAIEPIVVKHVAKRRGLRLIRVAPTMMTRVHPEHPTHIATPDAFYVDAANDSACDPNDAEAIGQVKVVSPFHADGWGKEEDNEIPDWVAVQVQWELHVARKFASHVGALIWPRIRTYTVQRDPELEGALVDEADRFWVDHVLAQRPPKVDGSEGAGRMVRRLLPDASGPRFKASDPVEAIARDFFDSKRDLEHAEQTHETAKQLLQVACGEADGIDGDGWRLHWRNRDPVEVAAKAYTRPAYRHFDMRASKKG